MVERGSKWGSELSWVVHRENGGPRIFFLREFFSRALQSERLEQANLAPKFSRTRALSEPASSLQWALGRLSSVVVDVARGLRCQLWRPDMFFIAPPLLANIFALCRYQHLCQPSAEEIKKLLETELSPIRANLQSIEKKVFDLKTSVDYMSAM